jgi:GT2 family glycosyltransferase
MDDGYFMYFEDIDFARRARKAGWDIRYVPKANVVHLRGGTSSVKAAINERRRIPKYYYEARSRYFAKFYGGAPGLWFTNLLWTAGRTVSFLREVLRTKKPHTCENEFRDNWTRAMHPMRESVAPGGGDL